MTRKQWQRPHASRHNYQAERAYWGWLGRLKPQSVPNDTPPSIRPHILILSKQFRQLGTKHSNIRSHGGGAFSFSNCHGSHDQHALGAYLLTLYLFMEYWVLKGSVFYLIEQLPVPQSQHA